MLSIDVEKVDNFLKDKSGFLRISSEWSRIKTALVELGTTHNIDYTAALEAELNKCTVDDVMRCVVNHSSHELATRLNSAVKAQQNSA